MTRNHNFRMNYTRFIENKDDGDLVSLNVSKYIEAIKNTDVLNPDIKLKHDSTTINYYGLLFVIDKAFNRCMNHNNKLGNPYSVDEVEELIMEDSIRYLNTNGYEYNGFIKNYDIPPTRSIALIYQGNNVCKERLKRYAMKIANRIYESHKYEPISQSLATITKEVNSKLKSLGYDVDTKVDTFSSSINVDINLNQAMEDMNKRIYSNLNVPEELLCPSYTNNYFGINTAINNRPVVFDTPGVLECYYNDLPNEHNENESDDYETIPRHRS